MYQFSFIVGMLMAAAVFGLLTAALMRLVAKKLTGFRPTWSKAFATNTGGFFINQLIGMALSRELTTPAGNPFFKILAIQSAIALFIYSALHLAFARNGGDQRPTAIQALVLGILQLVVGTLCTIAMWYFFIHGKK
ncbi:MAG: hypothetical protein QM760_23280 [Nibricoccus sp.]